MIGMIFGGGASIVKLIFGNMIGRGIAMAAACLSGVLIYGAVKKAQGAKEERVRIIEKTEAEGKDRNAKSAKIRRKIRSSKPGAAFGRLRREFSGSD